LSFQISVKQDWCMFLLDLPSLILLIKGVGI
jgi:hypothetical protein